MPDSLETQLLLLVRDQVLGPHAVFDAETNLYAQGLDSMALMHLLVLLERDFGVVVPERAVTRPNFCSIRQLATLIREGEARAA